MDFLDVFKPIIEYFLRLCAVNITIGGYVFTVGSMFIWCGVVVVVWSFIRRLAD